jgi:hypothetical protein
LSEYDQVLLEERSQVSDPLSSKANLTVPFTTESNGGVARTLRVRNQLAVVPANLNHPFLE